MDNNHNPLVSIITVVYNGEATIERTILSVIQQSYKNIQYIIIDGGSTDRTPEIINKYNSQISVIVSEKDNGIADAMNKGIALALGSVVGLINADDWFEPQAIEKVTEVHKAHPDSIIHGDMHIYSSEATFYLERAPVKPKLIKGMELNHPTVFVPISIYKKHGLFDTQYKIVFDWELMLRFKLAGETFIPINEVLSNFSVGGISTVAPKELMKEMHLIRKQYKVYKYIDKNYLISKLRLMLFGSSVIKISQKLRLLKHKIRSAKS